MLLIAFARQEEGSHATDTQRIRCTLVVRRGPDVAKVALHSPALMLPCALGEQGGQQVPWPKSFDPMDRLSQSGQRERKMILLLMSLSMLRAKSDLRANPNEIGQKGSQIK